MLTRTGLAARGYVQDQDRVGAMAADVVAGGQHPLFLAGQALPAVRSGDQPVLPGSGGGPAGVVDQHVLAIQLPVEVEVRAHDRDQQQRDDDGDDREDPPWPQPAPRPVPFRLPPPAACAPGRRRCRRCGGGLPVGGRPAGGLRRKRPPGAAAAEQASRPRLRGGPGRRCGRPGPRAPGRSDYRPDQDFPETCRCPGLPEPAFWPLAHACRLSLPVAATIVSTCQTCGPPNWLRRAVSFPAISRNLENSAAPRPFTALGATGPPDRDDLLAGRCRGRPDAPGRRPPR